MKSYQTKKIELPGGKFIEVVVFGDQHIEASSTKNDTVSTVTTDVATQDTERTLHVCPECSGELVYPVRWDERTGESWEITLRCPDCEWWHTGEFGDEAVDEFDEVLNDGTEKLLDSLRTFARVNMEEDIERFVKALEVGHIEPMDF